MRDPGRIERAFPLEFPMGIGGLFDDVRDEESTSLRRVPARVWAQHLFRLWDGSCVHGLRGHRLVWAVMNTVLLEEARGKGYIVQRCRGTHGRENGSVYACDESRVTRSVRRRGACSGPRALADEGWPERKDYAHAVGC